MSHILAKSAYKSLEERLNRFPQGAPVSDTLYKILGILFSEKEAALVAQLPIQPFTAKKAGKIWGMSEAEARKVLDGLASRCILMDMESNKETRYLLPPPMAGFLEFSMMRTRNDIDQKLLAELFYQYMNVEEDFVKELFFGTETRLGRVFVNESVLGAEDRVQILDFQKASHIIETAEHIGIGMCYCRHKMEHVGKNCDAPINDICMTFGGAAEALIRHDYARKIDTSEGLETLYKAYDYNLIQCGENVRNDVSFICNCCGCCCEALVATKKFGNLHPVETTGFIPELNADTCIGCGKCEKACQIEVIKMEAVDGKKVPVIDENICLGCGLCVRACPNKSLLLKSTGQKIITPSTSVHRVVLMAIEKGTLQELIFDNKALFSHRAMVAILSAILKMPPIKKAMASEQMRSVYLEKLIARQNI
ncbi:4Fe-4S dicluster domain-containing protein [Acetobacterium bakii]|uniref:(Fe-S)-binding protein n=1 Tax=Acetobacterium bakii TaxID=52689 RepID=A0A0L6U268_9FIRM|nr:4Fe-4S dicluster domain-containing protein [Acetobacterium bakii]KNZ42618.1 (Fe-S)-binding protein [Acetobacterium bakii]